MSSITLKNIPKHLHTAYKRRAARHARSLQSEILYTLSESLASSVSGEEEPRLSTEEVAGIVKPARQEVTLGEMDAAVNEMFREEWRK
jgi:plasmid stability protein